MATKEFQTLTNKNAMSWAALLEGFNRGWVSQLDVANYASEWLKENPQENVASISLLAGSEHDSSDEIRAWLAQANEQGANEDTETALKRWRLGALMSIADDDSLVDDEKVMRLQEVYAQFGFPEDMAACSPYYVEPNLRLGQSGISPLGAMAETIRNLEREVLG